MMRPVIETNVANTYEGGLIPSGRSTTEGDIYGKC